MGSAKSFAIAALFLLAAHAGPAVADAVLDADLRFTASLGDAGRVETLIEQGANPNAPDEYGLTPLHYAATSDVQTVKTLLAHGAKVDSADRTGETPLHRCLLYSWTNRFDAKGIAQTLIEGGAKVNATDNAKATPLAYAKDPQLVALLKAHGAKT